MSQYLGRQPSPHMWSLVRRMPSWVGSVKTLLLVLALLLSGRTLAKFLSSSRSEFSHQINKVRPSYHQYAFLLFWMLLEYSSYIWVEGAGGRGKVPSLGYCVTDLNEQTKADDVGWTLAVWERGIKLVWEVGVSRPGESSQRWAWPGQPTISF